MPCTVGRVTDSPVFSHDAIYPAAVRPVAEHVVLLGDSIFANAAYVGGEPDVIGHLRTLLPPGWKATLCAVDGATTATLPAQLNRLPTDASRLFVSVGGNDALANVDLLSVAVSSSSQTLALFAKRIAAFEKSYDHAIEAVTAHELPTTVCTIYNGRLPNDQVAVARTALSLFNDVVMQVAARRGLDVIELRAICDEACDYANAIEPSTAGGHKIAMAIAATLGLVRSRTRSRLWAGGAREAR